jgi:hypothetical protein
VKFLAGEDTSNWSYMVATRHHRSPRKLDKQHSLEHQ